MALPIQLAAKRLEDWVKDQALPLWLKTGMDPQLGAHHEQLLPDGRPDLSSPVRVRVQARQAFAFAFSYHRGWAGSEARSAAERLLHFLNGRAAHPDGGYTHLLNNHFEVIDNRLDLYDHAFHLLAHAWCYRAFGDARVLRNAEALVAFLDSRFGSACGGWIEGDYLAKYRRQNPHMHLFEAFLALYEATQEARWLARAGELFTLFQTRFYDPGRGLLFEYFMSDWSRAGGAAGDAVEPGHMLEWAWLLGRYGGHMQRPVEHYSQLLYKTALEVGESSSGLILDQVNLAKKSAKAPATKRCWPMTELIKAALTLARAGDKAAEARAVKGVDDLFHYYLCAATPGAYVDQRGPADEVLVDAAPASTLYHLVTTAAELADYCHDLAESNAPTEPATAIR